MGKGTACERYGKVWNTFCRKAGSVRSGDQYGQHRFLRLRAISTCEMGCRTRTAPRLRRRSWRMRSAALLGCRRCGTESFYSLTHGLFPYTRRNQQMVQKAIMALFEKVRSTIPRVNLKTGISGDLHPPGHPDESARH